MLVKPNIGFSTPIRVLIPRLPDAQCLLPYLARIDQNRSYSNYGPLSREFAAALSARTGAAGVTLTCNGTSAIELALRCRSVPGRGLCLMPSFTFIASAHAVCNAGLTPYLLEVEPRTLACTPAIADRALATLTEQPAAIVVVSAFGAPPDLPGWEAFEARTGVPVVFDAAAAATSLSRVGHQPICVSLHATKLLGVGEGGAILCADQALIEHSTAMTGFGFLGRDRVSAVRGGNYRMSEYAAAIGLASLAGLDDKLARIRHLTASYARALAGRASRLQSGVGDQWLTMTLNVVLPEGDIAKTIDKLDADKIEWRRWWGLGCHRHPAFAEVPRADLSATDELAPRVLGVPFHDALTDEDIIRVAACLP